jgi:CRP-like cAMP-binding protein
MGIEDDITVLERVPTFAVLGRDALRILAIGAENREIAPGDVLFVAGDIADSGFLIQEGSFSLRDGSPESGGEMMIARSGALLGEFALLKETTRPVSAVAAEPARVLRIARTLFLKMLEGYPDAAHRLRAHMAARVTRTAEDISKVGSALDPHGRRR